jgi:hypothetical protein
MAQLTAETADELERRMLSHGDDECADIWELVVDAYVRICMNGLHVAGDVRALGTLDDKIAVAKMMRPRLNADGRVEIRFEGTRPTALTVPLDCFRQWGEIVRNTAEDDVAAYASLKTEEELDPTA